MRRFIASHAPVQDSDDILQEALARAWRRWSTYSPEKGSPRAWLLAIALDQSRRAAARGKQLYLLPDSSAFERSAEVVDVDRTMDIRSAVRALPDRQREAVVLYYYVDLSIGEMAEIMNCAAGTVKSTLSDARRTLSTVLMEQR